MQRHFSGIYEAIFSLNLSLSFLLLWPVFSSDQGYGLSWRFVFFDCHPCAMFCYLNSTKLIFNNNWGVHRTIRSHQSCLHPSIPPKNLFLVFLSTPSVCLLQNRDYLLELFLPVIDLKNPFN